MTSGSVAGTAAAIAIIAAATLAGAGLANALRHAHRLALRMAATALLVVVGLDLAPDIVRDVADTGSAQLLVTAACVATFGAAVLAARWICACGARPTTTTGAAIVVHRALEGAALTLVGSACVVIALVVHAAGEGFALQAYGMRGNGRARLVLALACVSPAVGALAFGQVDVPATVAPMLTTLVAGVLVAGAARLLCVGADRSPRSAGRDGSDHRAEMPVRR